MNDTRDREYTERLVRLQRAPWKRWLDVQAPYRWNLRRLHPGFTLEVGCGIGRNLEHLRGHGVGLDHNAHSVAAARDSACVPLPPTSFARRPGTSRAVSTPSCSPTWPST